MTRNSLAIIVFTVLTAAGLIYQGASMNPTKVEPVAAPAPAPDLVCFDQGDDQGQACVTPAEVRAVYTKTDSSLGSCPAPKEGLCTFTRSYTVILLTNDFGVVVKQSVEEVLQKLGTTVKRDTGSDSDKNG